MLKVYEGNHHDAHREDHSGAAGTVFDQAEMPSTIA